MGMFDKVLTKLGLLKPAAQKVVESKAPAAPVTPSVTHANTEKILEDARMELKREMDGFAAAAAKPQAVEMVDVMSKLKGMAKANPEELNWQHSIVDLLKLLDIDSSLASRKELAVELGCPAEKMDDLVQMNTWLHKAVLQKIAENGGNIPASMLD